MRFGTIIAGLAILAAAARAEAQVDQKRIDDAIAKGVVYLRTAESSGWDTHAVNCDELILLTLIHADVPEKDPKVQELLTRVMAAPLQRTYKVALLAMCLEELDRVKYQQKIRQCAQFLVDNMCQNGQWSYGEESQFANAGTPTGGNKPVVASAAKELKPEVKVKPKVVNKIAIAKQREGPPTGDNSNSQYAALGLRACHEAGIVIPKETVIKVAKRWWTTSQIGDAKGDKDNAVVTGNGPMVAAPRGWSYNVSDRAYSSMTAGAVGAACI
ncbi:MAG: hypothetical protein EHM91_08890 [Planctomycetota bacterium]|nr:MAG: hypothetical protein EHM91_08890 [Planctomycetota bacterium]